jgi:hypothetical protein
MGGIAEDALLAGRFTRMHGDVDLLVERSHLEAVLRQLRPLGYAAWATKGETADGEPFYLASRDAPVPIEIGVLDRDELGDLFLEIARVDFKLETGEAPVGYRVYLPLDTYAHPPIALEGVPVRCISPLANYHLRAAIGSRGTFGPLREATGLRVSASARSSFARRTTGRCGRGSSRFTLRHEALRGQTVTASTGSNGDGGEASVPRRPASPLSARSLAP